MAVYSLTVLMCRWPLRLALLEFNFELPGTVIDQRASKFRDNHPSRTIFIVNC